MFNTSGGSFSKAHIQGNIKTTTVGGCKIEDKSFATISEEHKSTMANNTYQNVANAIDQVATETYDFNQLTNPIAINAPKGDWMFGDEAKNTEQYGGNQGRLSEEFDLYANDPVIMEIINKYYPDADKEDLEFLFTKMDNVGCGYMAAVDTVFAEFANKSPEEFYKCFGFYPTTEKLNKKENKKATFYNYDYLFLDFFLYYAKRKGFTTIEEVYGNTDEVMKSKDISIEETGMDGTYENEVAMVFDDYLKERNIELNVVTREELTDNNQALDSKTIDKLLTDGNKIVIGGDGFNLYEPSDINNNGRLDDIAMEDIEPHTMYLVGTTGDPEKVVVSSWGNEYVMNIKDITDYVVYDYN